MKLRQLFNDESAVSPVIGVILMVAITVILAAVIGTFVLGLGDQVSQSQPSANIGFEYTGPLTDSSNDQIDITHKGGDKLSQQNLKVTVDGTDAWVEGTDGTNFDNNNASAWNTDSITAGATLEISDGSSDNDLIVNGDTVRVIWSADNGDTAIIAEGTVQ